MEVRKTFHQHLDELNLDLIKMAHEAIDSIEQARSAFAALDGDLAERIMARDDILDNYLVRIEAEGVDLLALQAPVAIDLRTIIVIIWLAQHIERLGDNCVNICKAIINLKGYTLPADIKEDIDAMFDRAIQMLVTAAESFKERDTKKAAELLYMDDAVDRINRKFLTTYPQSCEEDIELNIRLVMIARFIERIADHAVDIGENVRYMVTGQFEEPVKPSGPS